MKQNFGIVIFLLSLPATLFSQVRLNQVGFFTEGEKIAVVEKADWAKTYQLIDAQGTVVWQAPAVASTKSPFSGKKRQIVDFSTVTAPGHYTLRAKKTSVPVAITRHPLRPVVELTLDAYRIQRCQHPDNQVLVHPSAATKERPAGTVISCPGGWYDAGDYNKYPVNAGFSHGLLQMAYEAAPDYFQSLPNFLDENLHDLKWMLTMQDLDGGVYHKLTTPNFEEHIQPQACRQQRYVVQKSTQATLDFAACLAQASRIYRTVNPDFSKTALQAAERAFQWAEQNPTCYYDQPGNNKKYDPDCTTGMYDDTIATDEFLWAATELYLTTGNRQYIHYLTTPKTFVLPVWGDVAGLALFSALIHDLTLLDYRSLIFASADDALSRVPGSAFRTAHGNLESDFCWGSNGEKCACQGLTLWFAYRLTGDERYLTAARQDADWLLGRNALGYCYITGMGQHSPQNPHHRLSDSDDKPGPLPGFLVGGPNVGKQDQSELRDGWKYPKAADECYLDYQPSYATNEVTINWNAYILALAALLDQ